MKTQIKDAVVSELPLSGGARQSVWGFGCMRGQLLSAKSGLAGSLPVERPLPLRLSQIWEEPLDTFTLQTLANLAEIVGGAAVVGGVLFAMWQIRQYREQRRDVAAIEIVRSLQSREFIEAFRLLSQVPDGIGLQALRERGQEYEDAAIRLGAMGETIGYMTYRGVAPLESIREQAGGLLLVMWRKLHVWAKDVRIEQGYERWVEWWEWLAERLEQHEGEAALPSRPHESANVGSAEDNHHAPRPQ
jgi:hypothetical protein